MIYENYRDYTDLYRASDYSKKQLKELEAEQERIALMKANETAAVKTIVGTLLQEIQIIATKLTDDLATLAKAMKTYATDTLTADLEEGLIGNTAEAAKNYLTEIKQPDLSSPVKGG